MPDPQEAAAIKPTLTDRRLHPIDVRTSSPRFPLSPLPSPSLSSTRRRIGIAVDLSDESAYAVKWAVDNYLRPGDAVILLHVNSTTVLFGADWGTSPTNAAPAATNNISEFDNFTATKANHMAQPLAEASVPFKIHIVKDHDMQERLCLEIERLGLNAVIIGSRGIGGSRRRGKGKGKLGSVSDYCVQHCVCPVVVVRYNQAAEEQEESEEEEEEETQEFHDADEFQQN